MEQVQRELPTWRPALIVALVGLLLAAYGACSGPAYADRLMMPAGWRVTISDANDIIVRDETLASVEYIIDRKAVDEANANAEANRRLEQQLKDATSELKSYAKPRPVWQDVVWGIAWGSSLVAAFVLGTKL